MVWSEGNMSLKNPVTPPGIDPGTFRLVAQRLNHYATPDPTVREYLCKFVTVPRRILLRMTIQTKILENIRTQILCSETLVRKSHLLWIIWKTGVESDRPQMQYDTVHGRCMLVN